MESVLTDVAYPATPADVAAACGDVTLVLADGEADLGEVMNLLPRNAVGEPYQSEGDA